MTNEDKALIKETSDLLKQLKPLLNKVEKFICEPIDTTEGEPIETEQRWKPKYDDRYWFVTIAGDVIVASYPCKDTVLDKKYYNAGNCFETKEAAQKAAEAIKQYLSINKF
jgi:hypothetical protein